MLNNQIYDFIKKSSFSKSIKSVSEKLKDLEMNGGMFTKKLNRAYYSGVLWLKKQSFFGDVQVLDDDFAKINIALIGSLNQTSKKSNAATPEVIEKKKNLVEELLNHQKEIDYLDIDPMTLDEKTPIKKPEQRVFIEEDFMQKLIVDTAIEQNKFLYVGKNVPNLENGLNKVSALDAQQISSMVEAVDYSKNGVAVVDKLDVSSRISELRKNIKPSPKNNKLRKQKKKDEMIWDDLMPGFSSIDVDQAVAKKSLEDKLLNQQKFAPIIIQESPEGIANNGTKTRFTLSKNDITSRLELLRNQGEAPTDKKQKKFS